MTEIVSTKPSVQDGALIKPPKALRIHYAMMPLPSKTLRGLSRTLCGIYLGDDWLVVPGWLVLPNMAEGFCRTYRMIKYKKRRAKLDCTNCQSLYKKLGDQTA